MNQWLDSRTKTRHNFFTWKFQGFLSLVVLIFIPRESKVRNFSPKLGLPVVEYQISQSIIFFVDDVC